MRRDGLLKVATIAGGALGMLCAASPAGAEDIFYQEGFTDNLYRYDMSTGTEMFVGNMDGLGDAWGFAFGGGNTLYGFHRESASLYSIDTTDASTTLIGEEVVETAVESLAYDPASGSLLAVSSFGTLFSMDPDDGTTTLVGSFDIQGIDGLSVSPVAQSVEGVGMVLAGTVFAVGSGELMILDTAALTVTSVAGGTGADETLAFGPDGTLWGHDSNGAFSTIGLDPVSTTPAFETMPGLVFASAVIPSPGAGVLVGAFGVAAMRRRRRG